jgi:hypothetical protein
MSILRIALVGVGFLAILPQAAQAGPFMEWLCGCSPNMSSQTTYTPVYVPPTVVETAPAPVYTTPAPQTTYYAPAVTYTAPVTVYRPLPAVPRPTTTYYSPSGFASSVPTTVYRPVVAPVVTTTRLIPYTTYRMTYPAYSTYSLAPVYVSPLPVVPSYTMPVESYSPPPAPSCALPAESYNPPPVAASSNISENTTNGAPSLPPNQPSTYAPLPEETKNGEKMGTQEVQKPVTTPDLKSEPKTAPKDDAKSSGPDLNPQTPEKTPSNLKQNSLQNAEPNNNRDYTTQKPIRQASREIVTPAEPTVRVLSPSLWQPATN